MIVLLLLILLDFSRVFFFYSQMAAAAREAARQAVLESNRASNTVAPACDGSACQTPGVLPRIRTITGFGFPIVYSDSTSLNSPPSYGTYSGGSTTTPGTITLNSGLNSNTVYVFIYQLGTQTSPNPRWACPSCSAAVRTSGHQLVVVDLKMNFRAVTLSFIGSTGPGISLDAQSVERIEF
jgi:hypothetical protein